MLNHGFGPDPDTMVLAMCFCAEEISHDKSFVETKRPISMKQLEAKYTEEELDQLMDDGGIEEAIKCSQSQSVTKLGGGAA